jgi:hypothetical protein
MIDTWRAPNYGGSILNTSIPETELLILLEVVCGHMSPQTPTATTRTGKLMEINGQVYQQAAWRTREELG